MKNGFTLVELSIVLVIIGLLIGGILVGQSLIESAKINATVQQIQQFDAGVMAFKAKYKFLPGDSPSFGGDGDGVIDRSGNHNDSANLFNRELGNFWADTFPTKYIRTPNLDMIAKVHAPKANIDNAYNFIASGIGIAQYVVETINPRNYYVILSPLNYPASQRFQKAPDGSEALKPITLLALDNKIDDGQANTNNVISGSFLGGDSTVLATPNPKCSSGATYVLTNNSYECTPLIRIGAQTGNPL